LTDLKNLHVLWATVYNC